MSASRSRRQPRQPRVPRRTFLLALAGAQGLTLLVGTASAVSLASPDQHLPAAPRVVEEALPAPVVVPARPVAQPAARPKALRRPAARSEHVHPQEPVIRRVSALLRPTPSTGSSPRELMAQAVDRLPGYRQGDASFRMVPGLGSWGLVDLGTGVVSISPRVPATRMYDVVAHEWSHVLSVKAYDGDVAAALAAMGRHFGGSGITGAERAADCMARRLGATWTHYTSCDSATWQAGAQRLLARQPL